MKVVYSLHSTSASFPVSLAVDFLSACWQGSISTKPLLFLAFGNFTAALLRDLKSFFSYPEFKSS